MWDKIKSWFKRSETILWARLQIALGIVGAAVTAVLADPAINSAIQAALDPKYVPFYLIGFGLLTELLRRRNADL